MKILHFKTKRIILNAKIRGMKLQIYIIPLFFFILLSTASATEKIVMLRHAEKPAKGLGQLNCQGLNRALALPSILIKKFGIPSVIFSPNPSVSKKDHGQFYNYIRPLATIEPTAIRLGMPVNTVFGFDDIKSLKEALYNPIYENSIIYVVWEHHILETMTRELLLDLGKDPREVPKWEDNDFDSIYVVTITDGNDGHKKVTFMKDNEGLNNSQTSCPN